MKIALASDIHLEFDGADRDRALNFPANADVIVLAGDITGGVESLDEVFDLTERYANAHVVWVAGNHEFYDQDIEGSLDRWRRGCEEHPRVHFLENSSVTIGSVRFIGCTLWTDFSVRGMPKEDADFARDRVSDYRRIRSQGDQLFTPENAIQRFRQSCEYLEETLATPFAGPTVVVTHFPPGLETRNQKREPEAVVAYRQANVIDLVDRYQPALWLYGHNHWSADQYRGLTRLVSNQLGYPHEQGRLPPFDACKLIELDSQP